MSITLRGNFVAIYLEFPTQANNRHGAGGWSKRAKHKPRPNLIYHYPRKVKTKGKSVFLDDVRKLKLNLFRLSNGETMREDYGEIDVTSMLYLIVRGEKKERHEKL